MGGKAPLEALAYATEYDAQYEETRQFDDFRATQLSMTMEEIAANDPQLMSTQFDLLPVELQPYAAERVAEPCFARDANEAFTWLQSMPDEPILERAWYVGIESYMHSNPAQAIELASHVQGQPQRFDFMKRSALKLYQTDPTLAAELIEDSTVLTREEKTVIFGYFDPADVVDILLP